MQKVFHFDSPRDPYRCDAAVIWCFDHRFDLAFRKFLKRRGVITSDPIKVAGGAKSLASPTQIADREFLLNQVRTSIRLHGTELVILMLHSDCGAYGGLAAFGNNAQAEAEHHHRELQKAAAIMHQAIPTVEVSGYYVNFEGIFEADLKAV